MARMARRSERDIINHLGVDADDKRVIEALTGSRRFKRYDYISDSKGRVRASKGYDIRLGQDWISALERLRAGR